jgi:hypothetical protein
MLSCALKYVCITHDDHRCSCRSSSQVKHWFETLTADKQRQRYQARLQTALSYPRVYRVCLCYSTCFCVREARIHRTQAPSQASATAPGHMLPLLIDTRSQSCRFQLVRVRRLVHWTGCQPPAQQCGLHVLRTNYVSPLAGSWSATYVRRGPAIQVAHVGKATAPQAYNQLGRVLGL